MPPTSELLTPIEYNCGKPNKSPKQVEKFDKLTGKNTKITILLRKDVFKVVSLNNLVTSNKITTPDKLITLRKIWSNAQK